MIFTLETLQAQEGDCLLLHWGTKEKPRLAVIDGGPGQVYEKALKPRLEAIAEKRGMPLTLDLVMVSHVDNDHIVGIKKLFRDLKKDVEDETANEERTFKADRLWHNTFNDILGDGIDKYYQTLPKKLTASVDGEPSAEVIDKLKENLKDKGEDEDEAAHVAYDIGLLLAGHGEGRELRDSHAFLLDHQDITALNLPFEKNGKPTLITAEMTPEPRKVFGLSFKVVGPMRAQIEKLQKAFDKYIKDNGLTVEAMLAAYADKSVPNLSSIVTLVTMDGKSILLTGDARGDFVIEGLKKAELLKDNKPLKVHILKVPHHGSARNVEKDFFDKIVADTYVISADGKHGNPDRETIEWLTEARGKSAKYDIVFTYPIADLDKVRKAKSKKPWNAAKHSLAALLEARKADGYKFNIVAAKGAKIELGDKISW